MSAKGETVDVESFLLAVERGIGHFDQITYMCVADQLKALEGPLRDRGYIVNSALDERTGMYTLSIGEGKHA